MIFPQTQKLGPNKTRFQLDLSSIESRPKRVVVLVQVIVVVVFVVGDLVVVVVSVVVVNIVGQRNRTLKFGKN